MGGYCAYLSHYGEDVKRIRLRAHNKWTNKVIYACKRCRQHLRGSFRYEPMIKIRRTWTRKPQTQVKQSDKLYKRSKAKQQERKELLND